MQPAKAQARQPLWRTSSSQNLLPKPHRGRLTRSSFFCIQLYFLLRFSSRAGNRRFLSGSTKGPSSTSFSTWLLAARRLSSETHGRARCACGRRQVNPRSGGRAHRHLGDLPQTPTWEEDTGRVPSFTAHPLTDAQAITRTAEPHSNKRLLSILKIFTKRTMRGFHHQKKITYDKFCKSQKSHVHVTQTTDQAEKCPRNTSLLPPPPGPFPGGCLCRHRVAGGSRKLLHTFKHGNTQASFTSKIGTHQYTPRHLCSLLLNVSPH